MAVMVELPGALIGGDGMAQQLGLSIQPAQTHIGVGDLGLKAQARAGQIASAGLRLGTGSLHAVAHAPQKSTS
jgi:hypothetical protein